MRKILSLAIIIALFSFPISADADELKATSVGEASVERTSSPVVGENIKVFWGL